VDSHHGVKKKGKVNPFGFNGQLKFFTITVKSPWPFYGCNGNLIFISPIKKAIFKQTIRRLIDKLNRSITDCHHGDYRNNNRRLNTNQSKAGLKSLKSNHCSVITKP